MPSTLFVHGGIETEPEPVWTTPLLTFVDVPIESLLIRKAFCVGQSVIVLNVLQKEGSRNRSYDTFFPSTLTK